MDVPRLPGLDHRGSSGSVVCRHPNFYTFIFKSLAKPFLFFFIITPSPAAHPAKLHLAPFFHTLSTKGTYMSCVLHMDVRRTSRVGRGHDVDQDQSRWRKRKRDAVYPPQTTNRSKKPLPSSENTWGLVGIRDPDHRNQEPRQCVRTCVGSGRICWEGVPTRKPSVYAAWWR